MQPYEWFLSVAEWTRHPSLQSVRKRSSNPSPNRALYVFAGTFNDMIAPFSHTVVPSLSKSVFGLTSEKDLTVLITVLHLATRILLRTPNSSRYNLASCFRGVEDGCP